MWSELVTCQQFHKFISAVEIMKNSKKFASHPRDCMFSGREMDVPKKKICTESEILAIVHKCA